MIHFTLHTLNKHQQPNQLLVYGSGWKLLYITLGDVAPDWLKVEVGHLLIDVVCCKQSLKNYLLWLQLW